MSGDVGDGGFCIVTHLVQCGLQLRWWRYTPTHSSEAHQGSAVERMAALPVPSPSHGVCC